jgi:uncharacterized membrane protein
MTTTDRRIGLWSARIIVALAITYILTGLVGITAPDASGRRAALQQVDPYLAILETIMIAVVVTQVVLFSAIHAYAQPDQKTYSLIALIFVSLVAAISGGVHFVMLTVGRQSGNVAIPGPGPFYPWPTVLFSLDLLAWDVFQGLGLLFVAPIFRGKGLAKAIRMTMSVSGALCIIGVAGPASGDLRFQIPAIFGYAGGLTVACVLLAFLFARPVAKF